MLEFRNGTELHAKPTGAGRRVGRPNITFTIQCTCPSQPSAAPTPQYRAALAALQRIDIFTTSPAHFETVMPPGEEFRGRHRKRKLTVDAAATTDPDHQPLVKRRRPSRQSRSGTPPEFWDNLSRIPLCRRALREFNRRRARSPVPQPPVQSDIDGELVKQLKRFARRGGPSLRDIRGVGAYP